jgi:hypothetical protein
MQDLPITALPLDPAKAPLLFGTGVTRLGWSIAKPEKPSGVGRANIHHVLIANNCWCQIGILPIAAMDQSRGRLEDESLVRCRPGKNEILAHGRGS